MDGNVSIAWELIRNKVLVPKWRPLNQDAWGGGPAISVFVCVFVLLFSATYGSSQARDWIGATTAGLHHSHSSTRSKLSVTYTAAHSNTGSLTHWAMPGIEPMSSWMLLEFFTTESQQELPRSPNFLLSLQSNRIRWSLEIQKTLSKRVFDGFAHTISFSPHRKMVG